MLNFILKSIGLYLVFFCIACLTLFIASTFLDIEKMALVIYDHLHIHYNLYNKIYDFNPALGDIIIIWAVFLPLFSLLLYYAFAIYKNRIKK